MVPERIQILFSQATASVVTVAGAVSSDLSPQANKRESNVNIIKSPNMFGC
jgi:hypothetical protein